MMSSIRGSIEMLTHLDFVTNVLAIWDVCTQFHNVHSCFYVHIQFSLERLFHWPKTSCHSRQVVASERFVARDRFIYIEVVFTDGLLIQVLL